jgi:transcription initiation factor TFIIIB Brf1 subunit/transcription initiation factor TFIIB
MRNAHSNENNGYACIHAKFPKNLATIESEVVCIVCGIVQSNDLAFEEMPSPDLTKTTLYQNEVGNPHNLLPKDLHLTTLKKIRTKKSSLSVFSTICESLKLPNNASIQAYTMFTRIYKKQNMKKRISKSCAAKYSLYLACESFAIPKTEVELDTVLKNCFNVKTVPKYIKCCSLLQNFTKNELRMNVSSDTLNFHINLYLKKAVEKYSVNEVRLRQEVWKVIDNFQGNPRAKARKAVDYVLKGVVAA